MWIDPVLCWSKRMGAKGESSNNAVRDLSLLVFSTIENDKRMRARDGNKAVDAVSVTIFS